MEKLINLVFVTFIMQNLSMLRFVLNTDLTSMQIYEGVKDIPTGWNSMYCTSLWEGFTNYTLKTQNLPIFVFDVNE